jgi:rubrerythrin
VSRRPVAGRPGTPGVNRTGIAAAPDEAEEGTAAAHAATPGPRFDAPALEVARLEHHEAAPSIGSVPPPASVKGVVKAAIDAARGKNPLVLVDLIGERLAFERTATRLYEALLVKLEVQDPPARGGPTREEVERIRDEELRHFALLEEAAAQLGADATALTPSADVGGVATAGLIEVATDPRTTLTEGLHALLVAELIDNDGWLILADVAARLGQDDLGDRFRQAMADEEDHLAHVRAWVAAAIDTAAGLTPAGDAATSGAPYA